jgi:hypothetical protein
MQLAAGELVHLQGANGSGKSSLLRVLAGVVEPRRGSVGRTAACAYMPERIALPESLPARRCLRIRGSGATELAAELDRRCGALSNGQLQRLVLTTALEDRPPSPRAYLMDEPWSGLDGDARAALDARLAEFVAHGSAVLYTDHGHEADLAPPSAPAGPWRHGEDAWCWWASSRPSSPSSAWPGRPRRARSIARPRSATSGRLRLPSGVAPRGRRDHGRRGPPAGVGRPAAGAMAGLARHVTARMSPGPRCGCSPRSCSRR